MTLLDFDSRFVHNDLPPLIIDSFAGGGGASTGIEMALGRSPDIAINHNPAALALHAANHPDTLHLSENVWQVDPFEVTHGRHVGLAWFSPDCKHFSKAKGGKPVERNIRDLAWVVCLWAERRRPDVILLENVEEFRDWGPLIETDRGLMPDPDGRGKTFQKWCKQLRRLGYRIEWRELRACDYGAPTIRKRLFLIARCDGQRIVWPRPTHGKPDDPDVIAGRKLAWRTAAEIIDWSLPCPSIFDTGAEIMQKLGLRAVRPLADATMSRVARGVDRYVLKAKKPFLVNLQDGVYRVEDVHLVEDPDDPYERRGRAETIAPSVIRFNTGATGHDARDPLATVTANSFKKRPGGAAPLGVVAPVLSAYYGKGEGSDDRSASVEKPINTVVTENRHAVIAPVLTYVQQGGANRSVEDPAHTITASKKDQNAVVIPTLVGCGGRAGQSRARGGDEPMATQTAKADVCVAAAFLAQNNYQEPGHDAREPVSTIVQKGSTQSVVAAFVSRQFGTSVGHDVEEPTHTATAKVNKSMLVAPHLMTMRNAGKPFNGADEPTHTITAGGAGISVVAPFMQKYYGTGDGSRLDEPCHSVTTKDRFGFVEGEIGWPPFTEAQAARARQVADFMRAHGFWDEREFVTLEISGETFTIVDIGMRMLTPRELFSAQGFPPDYVIELDFNGKPLPKSDQIACCGNSVSPPMAAALVAANCSHLVRYREAAE
ncbi:DNA cytosine methyltransferase [Mesorhizobium sp.]|uniref:DNA cytosine methyltransferase n=1 Tax=Mesorhizobium sp. TaxID=1871066 RepID=UPI000FE55D59|nr:DNA cytosine methyltransferase [Mesorhizobium sp.]RWP64901.1 MAG: C-5 cytosine-specific DNA methylase [Mesorhizobium sp.]